MFRKFHLDQLCDIHEKKKKAGCSITPVTSAAALLIALLSQNLWHDGVHTTAEKL